MRHCSRKRANSIADLASLLRSALVESATGSTARGSAVIEFVFLAVLLLLPVVYLVVALAQLQGAAFAATGAVDQASKVYIRESTAELAELRAEQAVLLALDDFGLKPEQAELRISCEPANCQASGTRVTVALKVRVPLPLLPSLPGFTLTAATLEADAAQLVGRFR